MITCNILFSGIGAQEAALKRLGLDFKVIGISEIDKYAIQSYEAINGPTRNYGDITQIERLDYADLWTYSFCCQDISQAGKQKGFVNADGSLTRSGLLKHVERLLTDSVLYGTQPKYLLLENVKALVSKKFMPDFQRWLDKLEQLGYNNYWQVLNAKDYGIPQNRERVFVVSIRKDIDTKGYKFPSPVPLKLRLKDMLEPCVDEKYYLNADKVEKFLQNGNTNPSGKGMNGNVCTGDICNTLTTNKGEGLKIKEVSNTIRCGGGSLDGKHTWDIIATPVNLDKDGNARAICNNYSKQGVDNILGLKGFGCTGVIEPSKELIFVGGIGEPNRLKDGKHLSRNYKDGYRVYDEKGISTTINANGGGLGGTTGLYLTNEPLCAASRGRNPENPSDRTAGIPTEQTLEINHTVCTNTLTSVQKDNYVVEPKVIQVENIVSTGNWDNPQIGRIYSSDGCSPTLNTCGGGSHEPKILEEGCKNAKNKTIRTLLRILWKEIREKKVWEQIGRFQCVSETEILQQGMYEKVLSEKGEEQTDVFKCPHNNEKYKCIIIENNFLRDMWLSIKFRRSSQRWGLSEQQFRELTSSLQKLSYEATPEKEKLCYMWETDESFRVLRETLSEIQEIWKSINIKSQNKYKIRKLTARECWRLMAFTDIEFDCAKLSGVSDTRLYQQAGNSIVVDVLVAIFRELFND